MRKWMVLILLAGLSSLSLAQMMPTLENKYDQRGNEFIRNIACDLGPADTVIGPSVYVFGARALVARIRANQGACSLLVFDVSNNDTSWVRATSGAAGTAVTSDVDAADSLNQGGQTAVLYHTANSNVNNFGLRWRYARPVVFRKADRADVTNLCEGKVDSLRFQTYVQWSAP